MYYVLILACLMWIAVQTGSPFGSLGSLCSLASVHVEFTWEISSIFSLVPDNPNHATCLPDRARRLPDMSPIRHQASLANSMICARGIWVHWYACHLGSFVPVSFGFNCAHVIWFAFPLHQLKFTWLNSSLYRRPGGTRVALEYVCSFTSSP